MALTKDIFCLTQILDRQRKYLTQRRQFFCQSPAASIGVDNHALLPTQQASVIEVKNFAKADLEPKLTTDARSTAQSNLPTHQLYELLADRGSKTSSAVFSSGGAIGLCKALEYPILE